ncbi:MAG: DUF2163 domain-containing protein [Novosphingobium sp.]
MSRAWFSQPLETVAVWWRIERRDGVALGLTSHDRDLVFAGLRHRTAPGMVPSAVRRSATLEPDSAEVAGAISHDAISEADLATGRCDGARVSMGLVDWETLESESLFAGTIGAVAREGGRFSAELASIKQKLAVDLVPRTSPTCRAEFCGKGCTLSAARFMHEASLSAVSADRQWVQVDGPATQDLAFGWIRMIDGSDAGITLRVQAASDGWLVLERALGEDCGPGDRLLVREGCDQTLATCSARFGNAVNFQGEPFLPGNDLLTRYPAPTA